jgi:hypothetical protein
MVVESLMEHGEETLRTMIENQAHWTGEDLKRLKLIR